MKASPLSRKTASLSESIHQQLNMYALAATAAGVGALCLTHAAEAKVVYTPANVKIAQNSGLIRFDLNHDGIADFGFRNFFSGSTSRRGGALRVFPLRQMNEVWGTYTHTSQGSCQNLCAAALPKGTKVGPKGKFQIDPPIGLVMAVSSFVYHYGPWRRVTQAYLGLKFVIKGKKHFGWARVKISIARQSITATLTGYAYETIPNKSIIAGQTKGPDDTTIEEPQGSLTAPSPQSASLGTLALGAPGLSVWRREELVSGRQ